MSRSGRSRRLRLETAPGRAWPPDSPRRLARVPVSTTAIAKALDDAAIDFSRMYNDGLEAACDGGLAIPEGQRLRESYDRLVGAEPPP